jgi:hypothetical protein
MLHKETKQTSISFSFYTTSWTISVYSMGGFSNGTRAAGADLQSDTFNVTYLQTIFEM